MKRYSYPLIMLLCLPQFNQVFSHNGSQNIQVDLSDGSHNIQVALITGVTACVCFLLGHKIGKSSEQDNKEAELKHQRLERETKENSEQERQRKLTQRFHQIEGMTKLGRTFVDHFRGQAPPERWNDKQQRSFAQEIMASGSITAFEEQLNTHIKSYETFDPETAHTHKDLHCMMLLLKGAMHTNQYVTDQKRIEEEETFKKRERQAYLKKAENEAKAAQGLVTAIAQVKEMALTIKDTTHRSQQQLINQGYTLESTLNRRLTELNDWQSRRASEHEKSIKEQKKIQEALGKLNKKAEQTQKDVASIKEEIKQERSNQEAKPTAPPADAVPSYPPPSNYDPRYAAQSANPPAYNPEYRA